MTNDPKQTVEEAGLFAHLSEEVYLGSTTATETSDREIYEWRRDSYLAGFRDGHAHPSERELALVEALRHYANRALCWSIHSRSMEPTLSTNEAKVAVTALAVWEKGKAPETKPQHGRHQRTTDVIGFIGKLTDPHGIKK